MAGQRMRTKLTSYMWSRDITDEDLASRVGMSRAQVNRIRNGRVVPRITTALAIAEACNRRVRDLFAGM